MNVPTMLVVCSGPCSPVSGSTLRGIVETVRTLSRQGGTVYAAWRGLEGVLREELLDLSIQDEQEIAFLRNTPAVGCVGVGSSGSDFSVAARERLAAVLQAHGIDAVLCVGGPAALTSARLLRDVVRTQGLAVTVVGVPVWAGNDLGDAGFTCIDHTPGYGSVARHLALAVAEADEAHRVAAAAEPVLLLATAGGSRSGFVLAAARLADPRREMPLLIGLPEAGFTPEEMSEKIEAMAQERGRALAVVPEGGDAAALAAALRARGVAAGIQHQGSAGGRSLAASVPDLDEAFRVGQKAVLLAANRTDGSVAVVRREQGTCIYTVCYEQTGLEQVPEEARSLPEQWLTEDRVDVTDAFLSYARPLLGEDNPSVPLLGGRQRFAMISPVFAVKRLEPYAPAVC